MSARPPKTLNEEDRVLWSLVARSTSPLKGRAAVEVPHEPPMTMAEALQELETPVPTASARKSLPGKVQTVATAFDRPTRDKLSKGRLPIEGRVDLHGLTQEQAYSLLLSFLTRAHAGGVRYVLVITGKGNSSGGEGVLRRAVPGWLSTPPFRALVGTHDAPSRNHGGAGALYIRLRRKTVPS